VSGEERPLPKFDVGDHVLVDQAGPGRVQSFRWAHVPVADALAAGAEELDEVVTEPGYLYEVVPLDGPGKRVWTEVPERDLMDSRAALIADGAEARAEAKINAEEERDAAARIEVLHEEIQRGIEEAAATIVGPFVPLLQEMPALLSVLSDQLHERMEPFVRAALTFELRDVEERMHRLERSGKRRQEPAEFGGQNEVAKRLGVLRARAEAIRAELWPEPEEDAPAS
jgi:hypothetical protein